MAFAIAALVSLYSYTLTKSWTAWPVASAAEIIIGILAAKQWRLPRTVAGSWLTGVIAVVAVGVSGLVI